MGFHEDINTEPFTGPLVYRNSVTGYRLWFLKGNGRLRSKSWSDSDWAPGVNLAVCLRNLVDPHDAPAPGCKCGFFAMVRRPELTELWDVRRKDHPSLILGMVKGSGNVIPGTKGWRAARAEILALYFDPEQEFLRWNRQSGTSRFVDRAVQYYRVPGFKDYRDFVTFAKENEQPYEMPGVAK